MSGAVAFCHSERKRILSFRAKPRNLLAVGKGPNGLGTRPSVPRRGRRDVACVPPVHALVRATGGRILIASRPLGSARGDKRERSERSRLLSFRVARDCVIPSTAVSCHSERSRGICLRRASGPSDLERAHLYADDRGGMPSRSSAWIICPRANLSRAASRLWRSLL